MVLMEEFSDGNGSGPQGMTVKGTIFAVRVIRNGFLDRALYWNQAQIDRPDVRDFAYEQARKLGLEHVYYLAPGQDIENEIADGIYACAIEHVFGKEPPSLKAVRDHGGMTGSGFGRIADRNNNHIRDPYSDDWGQEQRAFDDNYRLKQMGF